ncbi:MAG TPA: hypothetical protein VFM93_06315 [Candidatus Limnocylindria bacterium]|nr:hypothetical protein [Candidatus Limnocylindria bacterium]
MTLAARPDSATLHLLEERLREYLEDRVGVRTRAADLRGARAFLVSGARPDDPKGLVVDRASSHAERVYLYLHVAAHVALRHDVPVMTIVEPRPGTPDPDAELHERAESVVRQVWWGRAGERELRALLPRPLARPLRLALRLPLTRGLLRLALLGLRRAYYGVGPRAVLDRIGLTRAFREALWVTSVVCAAPQLAREARRT